ncbi:calcium:proton antiporter, partial [Rhizobium ruizarguesonis]
MTDVPALRAVGANSLIREEWFLVVSVATSLAFFVFQEQLFGQLSYPLWFTFVFAWLFAAVLGSALSVVRHADH